jgi:hypothetical protein
VNGGAFEIEPGCDVGRPTPIGREGLDRLPFDSAIIGSLKFLKAAMHTTRSNDASPNGM